MTNYLHCLLRTNEQRAEFIAQYGKYIVDHTDEYVAWVMNMPSHKWVDYLADVPEKDRPVIIGVLCILICNHTLEVNFNEDATKIMRFMTDQEWAEVEAHRRAVRGRWYAHEEKEYDNYHELIEEDLVID